MVYRMHADATGGGGCRARGRAAARLGLHGRAVASRTTDPGGSHDRRHIRPARRGRR
ncbi:protein of unknown function [Microbacterium sp. Nx66]|nr:protein of unknown function [Microbacterium sp. Nx66]